jgi:hypothetical protein
VWRERWSFRTAKTRTGLLWPENCFFGKSPRNERRRSKPSAAGTALEVGVNPGYAVNVSVSSENSEEFRLARNKPSQPRI